MRRSCLNVFFLALPALCSAWLIACSRPAKTPDANAANAGVNANAPGAMPGAARAPKRVTLLRSVREDVPYIFETPGSVTPLNTVDLRPQITSRVVSVAVREGQEVREGQTLFTLDAQADAAKLAQSQAQLEQNRSQLREAELNFKRQGELLAQQVVAQSVFDTARNNFEALKAAVSAQEAAVESARAALAYQTIRAPFTGRAGALNVHPGSLVTANMTLPLITVTQMDPIAVAFNLPQREFARLLRERNSGREIQVTARMEGESRAQQGQVYFFDNAVDSGSQTVAVKARFANARRLLWPGAFASVQVALGSDAGVIALPAAAVRNGPEGQFVYRVEDGRAVINKVSIRRIFSRPAIAASASISQWAIVEGLQEGVAVVTEGAPDLRPGDAITEASANAPPEQSPNKALTKP